MFKTYLTVWSYHKFGEAASEYEFSRTYKEFIEDINTGVFDWITLDDGHSSQFMASEILRDHNLRAKIGIISSLVGTGNYMSWDELKELSEHHDIVNHSHDHPNFLELNETERAYQIEKCNDEMMKHLGIKPRWFIPPFNKSDEKLEYLVSTYGMQLIKNRRTITNKTII